MAEMKPIKTLRFPNSEITYEITDGTAREHIRQLEDTIAELNIGNNAVIVPYDDHFPFGSGTFSSIGVDMTSWEIDRAQYELLQATDNTALVLQLMYPEDFGCTQSLLVFEPVHTSVSVTIPTESESADVSTIVQPLTVYCTSYAVYTPSGDSLLYKDPITFYIAFRTPEENDTTVIGYLFGGIMLDGIRQIPFEYNSLMDITNTDLSNWTGLILSSTDFTFAGLGVSNIILGLLFATEFESTDIVGQALAQLLFQSKVQARLSVSPTGDIAIIEQLLISSMFPTCVLPQRGILRLLDDNTDLRFKWIDTKEIDAAYGDGVLYIIPDYDDNTNEYTNTWHIGLGYSDEIAYDVTLTGLEDLPEPAEFLIDTLPKIIINENQPYLKHLADDGSILDYKPMNLQCVVVDELPTATQEEAQLNKLYSCNQELYKPFVQKTSYLEYPLNYYDSNHCLPSPINGGAYACVDGYIYMFGGYLGSDETGALFLKNGWKINCNDLTVEEINVTFDVDGWENCSAAAIGTNIYIGKNQQIWIFDTVTNTLIDSEWILPSSICTGSTSMTSWNHKLYFLGEDSTLVEIDIDTNEIVQHNLFDPHDYGGVCLLVANDTLYMIGGFESVTLYSIDLNTYQTTQTELSVFGNAYFDFGAVVFNTDLILFGGQTNTLEGDEWLGREHQKKVYKFDTLTNTLQEITSITLNGNNWKEPAVILYQDKIYYIGGKDDDSSDAIYRYQFTTSTNQTTEWVQLTSKGDNTPDLDVNVEANNGETTSATLNTLKVGNTNYLVPSGGGKNILDIYMDLTKTNQENEMVFEVFDALFGFFTLTPISDTYPQSVATIVATGRLINFSAIVNMPALPNVGSVSLSDLGITQTITADQLFNVDGIRFRTTDPDSQEEHTTIILKPTTPVVSVGFGVNCILPLETSGAGVLNCFMAEIMFLGNNDTTNEVNSLKINSTLFGITAN